LDLPEPLAYSLILIGYLLMDRDKPVWGWFFLGCAVFTKETSLIFVCAVLIMYASKAKWRKLAGLMTIGVIPFIVFQFWLMSEFGQFGVGSGGAMSTPFEWIPMWGFLRIGRTSLLLLGTYLVTFGPFILYPALWGIWKTGRQFVEREVSHVNIYLGLIGISFLFLPFSTYREPGGIIRYANGLVLALLLFVRQYKKPGFWRYAPLSLVLNLFLLEA